MKAPAYHQSITSTCTPNRTFHYNGTPVDLYWFSLIHAGASLPGFVHLLSGEEKDTSGRFRFNADRERFIFGRGVLRVVSSRYLYIHPGNITLEYGKYGKPCFAPQQNQGNLQFNLSHAGDMVFIGITRNATIGVDIEKIKTTDGMAAIIRRFAPKSVQVRYDGAAPTKKPEIFYRWWTRKEALGKARGCGLKIFWDSARCEKACFQTYRHCGYIMSVCTK
jgi:4'-phosphopantetheinyl transferase